MRRERESDPRRQHGGRELLFGRQPALEALRAGRRRVFRVLVAESSLETLDPEYLAAARRYEVDVEVVAPRDMDALCRGGNHQGVAVEAEPYPYAQLAEILHAAEEASPPPFLLLCDHIQDPHNLGAILRTAEAAGVHGVVVPQDRAAEVTAAVVRVSAGASEHVRVARVVNLTQTLRVLKERNIWVAGLENRPAAKLYTECDLGGPLAIVVGSEGEGMGRLVRENCDFLMRLPAQGVVSSLNASVAAGIVLYECLRQRSAAARPG